MVELSSVTLTDTLGDSFFCVFRTAREAVTAAAATQRRSAAVSRR